MILANYFSDIGERMVGDIDILVEEKNSQKAFNILRDNGYSKNPEHEFFPHRSIKHLKRQINENRLFAVEIHEKLLSEKNELLESDRLFLKSEGINRFTVPSSEYLLDHCIYNSEINDLGYILMNYNFKAL